MLKELLKSLSIDDIEKLLEVVYKEGRSDGWNENSIDNGYDGKCRDSFPELAEEIIKEPKKFLITICRNDEAKHRYNGICQLLTLEELANPQNNVCNRCMYSIGTERKECSHYKEFDIKAIERDNYKNN